MVVALRDVLEVNGDDFLMVEELHPAHIACIRPQLPAGIPDPLVQLQAHFCSLRRGERLDVLLGQQIEKGRLLQDQLKGDISLGMPADCLSKLAMHKDILQLEHILDAGDHIPVELPLHILLKTIQLLSNLLDDIAALHLISLRASWRTIEEMLIDAWRACFG